LDTRVCLGTRRVFVDTKNQGTKKAHNRRLSPEAKTSSCSSSSSSSSVLRVSSAALFAVVVVVHFFFSKTHQINDNLKKFTQRKTIWNFVLGFENI